LLIYLTPITGIRPLSALGVAHMFQRRRLVRQWHEDFPAIHTEGGLPGSESAGIVVFICERLVDLEEDSSPHEEDLEVQTSKVEGASEAGADTIGISSPPDPRPDARYIWDEIPLLDVEQSRLKVRANELA
jgi:hypothetical protein